MYKAVAVSTSGLFLALTSAAAGAAGLRIVDNDHPDKGVSAKIFLKSAAPPQPTLVARSDDRGYVQGTVTCGNLQSLAVEPIGDYYRAELDCPLGKNTIPLISKNYVATLEARLRALEAKGDSGNAALVSNELAARARIVGIPAEEWEVKTLKQAGHRLNVAQPVIFDPDQGRKVASEDLETAVKKVQVEHSLEADGKLNDRTLRAIAAGPSNVGGAI